MRTAKEIEEFWREIQMMSDIPFFTEPEVCYESEDIYKIQTREDYIFDDGF